MKGVEATLKKIMSYGAVGGEHELLNDAMGHVALAAADVGHLLLIVKFDDGLREIEIDGAVLIAAGIEKLREILHGIEVVLHVGIASGHFGIAGEDLVDVGVGHALGGADNALNHGGRESAAGRVKVHDGAHNEAILMRVERTHAVGEGFGEHGDGTIDEVD